MLPALGSNPADYSAASVRSVVLDHIRGCRPAQAKTIVGALRVYLRFLATNGACRPGLDHMIPTVAEWRLSSLPRYLDPNQVALLVESCRKDGPQGLRDRAIVLLLLRLALRAGDIVSMRQRISTGRMPRCWCVAKDVGTSVYLYRRTPAMRFWTT
jgi:site-specific recombinase XerC